MTKNKLNNLEEDIKSFTDDEGLAEYLTELINLNKDLLTTLNFYNKDGMIEYFCEHKVGHPIYSKKEDGLHECCPGNCCEKIQYPRI